MYRTICISILGLLAAAPAHALISRTYVASYGTDANSAYSCDFAHPCRTFQTALSQTLAGGEILAVDGSGYGPVTIDRSVSIIANPGVFAGIGVFAAGGAGVSIGTPGVSVTLRGLTINGGGGSYGVHMTNGARLSIEDCVFANFSSGVGYKFGVGVFTQATVRIVDSLFRDNFAGAAFAGGATAIISGSRFFGNDTAVWVSDTAGTTTTAFVERSVANGNSYGFMAESYNTGTTRLHITESVASGNSSAGISCYAGPGTCEAGVSNSLVSGNGIGLEANGAGARLTANGNTVTKNTTGLNQVATGVLESAGDNTVRNNSANTAGAITTFARM